MSNSLDKRHSPEVTTNEGPIDLTNLKPKVNVKPPEENNSNRKISDEDVRNSAGTILKSYANGCLDSKLDTRRELGYINLYGGVFTCVQDYFYEDVDKLGIGYEEFEQLLNILPLIFKGIDITTYKADKSSLAELVKNNPNFFIMLRDDIRILRDNPGLVDKFVQIGNGDEGGDLDDLVKKYSIHSSIDRRPGLGEVGYNPNSGDPYNLVLLLRRNGVNVKAFIDRFQKEFKI